MKKDVIYRSTEFQSLVLQIEDMYDSGDAVMSIQISSGMNPEFDVKSCVLKIHCGAEIEGFIRFMSQVKEDLYPKHKEI